MFLKYLLSFLVAILLLLQTTHAKELQYLEITGNSSKEISWTITSEKYWDTLKVQQGEETYTTINDKQLKALEWHLTNNADKTDILVKRRKNIITIRGQLRGKQINRTIKIDQNPWYQPMSYSLSEFVKSRKKSITFWTLNPTDLRAYKIKALNYGKENIPIDGLKIETYKVKIILTGFKSLFWHAFYWFRQKDDVLVLYKGIDGPPTTPITVIKLIKEN